MSFRGALQILGAGETAWLRRLNGLLGGVLLASGAAPGAWAVHSIWGWIDQKNEATSLLGGAVRAVSARLSRTGGLARHELVVAAHTTIVVDAFLATLRDTRRTEFDAADLSRDEGVMLATGAWRLEGESLVRHLYEADIPAPSAVRGFAENVAAVRDWAVVGLARVDRFLSGLGLFDVAADTADFADTVARRYRASFLLLARTVPEFKVWSDLGEHAATRTALARLEKLLSTSTVDGSRRDLRELVRAVNTAELDQPVVDVDTGSYGIGVVFPSVSDIFITPHFRLAQAGKLARLADETWWSERAPGRDLELVLARHFSTPEATRRPLLLLGHPGAGKSLLTKVLAARLPDAGYTVVRVPLRRVHADANVSEQIREGLALATNGRVDWPELSDQSAETVRVVLLDGLDELLQATTNDRGGYLGDIAEFQRIEAALGRPVAVVVTSRTLVADRVRVPDGTPVVKLDEFDDDQIAEWIRIWNRVNDATGLRTMSARDALAQGGLARQPILLLMLTLYFVDPSTEPTESPLSASELYERLLDTYARREAGKLAPGDLDRAVEDQLLRLATAALGMFNRGRQSITETELAADLTALGVASPSGGRMLSEFFFVHADEATTVSSVHRSYQFMHTTISEYLIATRVVDVVREIAEGSFSRRRFHDPDDELLFTLLSWQPLAIQRPTLEFIAHRFAVLDDAERDTILRTLDLLLGSYRRRRVGSRYPDYRPMAQDTIRALAAYSANLVVLRANAVATRDLPRARSWPTDEDQARWLPTANLWAAGLDSEGYRAMLSTVRVPAVTLEALLETAAAVPADTPAVVRALTQSAIDRATLSLQGFLGGVAIYSGEEQDWLLDLTRNARHSIDAVSLPEGTTENPRGFWYSSLGQRYLQLQREAVERGVSIRRVFVYNWAAAQGYVALGPICEDQAAYGIQVRLLNPPTLARVPEALFDFIIFDQVVSYEIVPTDHIGQLAVDTKLDLRPSTVAKRAATFEAIWQSAVPWPDFPR